MITIKLPYKSDYNISDLMRQYTVLVKSCYKKLLNGFSDKDIRLYIKTLNNVEDLDSRFIENAIIDGKAIQKENKVIFNRFNFIKRCKGKISKDEFKEIKYLPIVNYGETQQHGNRKFKLDLDNNKIVFKVNKGKHIDIILPKLKPNYKKELLKVQSLMELNELKVSFKLDSKYVYISYEEIKFNNTLILKDNRIMGLDLNPNNIGISILEFNDDTYKVIHTSFIDLFNNNKLIKNKKNYNIVMISKQIIQLLKAFNVKNISLEDLNMKSKNHNKGKKYNKLCNNDWNRNLFVNNLKKRCAVKGINVYNINPAYTSVIGNLMYEYSDPINASVEVARRGYQFNKMYIKNSFYPKFSLKNQWNQWKKEVGLFTEDWKDFYKHLKTLDMKYRVPINQLVYKNLCIKNIYFCIL